jgi:hypothetical protein
MALTIDEIIKSGSRQIIRRCYIKRVEATSKQYESDWLDISQYVVGWGAIEKSFQDQLYWGAYQMSGNTMTFNNRTRKFQPHTENASLWYNYLRREKTKFKITVTYIDDDLVNEVDGLTWYGVLYSNPVNDDSGMILFDIAPLTKVFERFPFINVVDAGDVGDTDAIIERICETTLSGVRVFDQYFEGVGDAVKYQINPDALSVQNIINPYIRNTGRTCWDVITDYSRIESFVPYVNASGNFVWDAKTETAAEQWKFNGGGSIDNDYGVNISAVISDDPGTSDLFTNISIGYYNYTDDVIDYKNHTVAWQPFDGSNQDIYGEVTYQTEIPDLSGSGSPSQAENVASNIYDEVSDVKRKIIIVTPLIPHLEIRDKVEVNYKGELSPANGGIWDISLWDTGLWSEYLGSINLDGFVGKIIAIAHDLDSLQSQFMIREV